MIMEFIDKMSMLLYGNVWLALTGALLWGVASVVLSPCHLSSIPLVMGFVAKESHGTQTRALRLSLVFTLGIMVSMLVLGLISASLGRLWGDVGSWGYWLGAAVFVLVGLLLLDAIHLPTMSLNHQRFRGGGYSASLLLGVLFGTVLGPWAFGFLLPVLGMVFAAASERPLLATGLVSAYAIGHGAVIVLAGSASVWTLSLMQNSRSTRWIGMARKVAGVVCLALAVWFVMKSSLR